MLDPGRAASQHVGDCLPLPPPLGWFEGSSGVARPGGRVEPFPREAHGRKTQMRHVGTVLRHRLVTQTSPPSKGASRGGLCPPQQEELGPESLRILGPGLPPQLDRWPSAGHFHNDNGFLQAQCQALCVCHLPQPELREVREPTQGGPALK